jgi:hypothetical protein
MSHILHLMKPPGIGGSFSPGMLTCSPFRRNSSVTWRIWKMSRPAALEVVPYNSWGATGNWVGSCRNSFVSSRDFADQSPIAWVNVLDFAGAPESRKSHRQPCREQLPLSIARQPSCL